MSTEQDILRLNRLKERSRLKRDSYANRIRSIHKLAQRSLTDAKSLHQLLVAVECLDDLWSSIVVEDEAVLDSLISLDL